MFSKLQNRLGTAGLVISVIALVFAMLGGAYAATSSGHRHHKKKKNNASLTNKQKKEVKKIARSFQGRGPAGPAGAAGAKGDAGSNGTNGSNGTDGKSVVAAAASESECPEGGTRFEVEGSGVSHKACNGTEGSPGSPGSPWTDGGTLPEGSTETGAWSFSGSYETSALPVVSISFPVPLAAALGESEVHFIAKNGKELVVNLEGEVVEEMTPTKCGSALTPAGTAEEPAAAPGNLCVYAASPFNPAEVFVGSNFITNPGSPCTGSGCTPLFGGPGAGAGTSGANLGIEYGAGGSKKGWGSWAVTG